MEIEVAILVGVYLGIISLLLIVELFLPKKRRYIKSGKYSKKKRKYIKSGKYSKKNKTSVN